MTVLCRVPPYRVVEFSTNRVRIPLGLPYLAVRERGAEPISRSRRRLDVTSPRFTASSLLLLIALAGAGCSGDSHPPDLAWEYDFRRDAFTFENFALEDRGMPMSADLAARMFGADVTCVGGALPCTPTPEAAAWIAESNIALRAGYSEGFAILSMLFATGDLSPSDFGAETAAELVLPGNIALQAELAYWSASQYALPPTTNRRFTAEDVMQFLVEEAFAEGGERYRLAIARRTEAGFDFAHALVPIGYYRGERADLYFLRVYDSNRPQLEQVIRIDEGAGTWTYDMPLPDGSSVLYEGTRENGNALYFAPIAARRGVLPAPFERDGISVSTEGGLSALASVGDARVGVQGGAVIEENGAALVPVFASCRCGSRGPMRMTIPASGGSDVELTYSGGIGMDEEGGGSVVVNRPGHFSVEITGIDGDASEQDTVRVTEGGELTVASRSGTPVRARVTYQTEDGEVEVTVVVDDGADSVSVRLTPEGKVEVDSTGVDEGETTQVTVTRREPDGTATTSETSYTSDGEDTSRVAVDPETGETTGVELLQLCANGVQDTGETDVDCGGTVCGGCDVGLSCEENADCNGFCSSGTCRNDTCEDGVLNGTETDTDCGGTLCAPCAAPRACLVGSDCEDGVCVAETCRVTASPRLSVRGLSPGSTLGFDVVVDGVATRQTLSPSTAADVTHVLPLGYAFDVRLDNSDPALSCVFIRNITGWSGEGSPTLSGTVRPTELDVAIVDCSYSTAAVRANVQGLPPGAVLRITRDLDGTADTVSFNQNGLFTLGSAVSYRLAILSQPDPVTYGGSLVDTTCNFDVGGALVTDTGFRMPSRPESVALRCSVTSRPTGDAGVGMDAGVDGGRDAGMVADSGVDSGVDSGPPPSCMSGCSAVFDVPTADGVAPSGTFTVPAMCTQVFVAAWGAGGGAGGQETGFPPDRSYGGAGGYVEGTLPVTPGDVFTVWVGQGGEMAGVSAVFGTASIGSLYGTPASGGDGDGDGSFSAGGGSGGGLTSVRQTGSATLQFSVPGGGGGSSDAFAAPAGSGGDATSGGATGPSGEDAPSGDGGGGGGAGEPGGVGGSAFTFTDASGGAFGVLSGALTPMSSSTGNAVNTGSPDYALCTARRSAAASEPGGVGTTYGGDGCVVIRCVP